VPVPWGVKVISLFEAVVEIVWPLSVRSSTTNEVIPERSVVAAAPKVIVWAPIKTEGYCNFAFVTPASVNWVVPIELLVTLIVIVFVESSKDESNAVPPVIVNVWFVSKAPEPESVAISSVVSTVWKAKLPDPSVFKYWPAVPSIEGKVKDLLAASAVGAFNST
jgi:hypothetical protein